MTQSSIIGRNPWKDRGVSHSKQLTDMYVKIPLVPTRKTFPRPQTGSVFYFGSTDVEGPLGGRLGWGRDISQTRMWSENVGRIPYRL